MALLNSLFSGVSGLQNLQSMMDVIGNNIANVNTIGFKGSRITFSDTFNQLIKSGTNPTDSTGGTNSFQVGLGMKVNSIDRNWNQGTFETTGINTDLALQGPGMFILKSNGQNFYSRAGAFEFDANGDLVDPQNGAVVQGKVANGLGEIPNGTTLQDIKIDKNLRLPAIKTTETKWGGNLSSEAPLMNVITESGNLNSTGTGATTAPNPKSDPYTTIKGNDGTQYRYQSWYSYSAGKWNVNYQIYSSDGSTKITSGLKALDFSSGKCVPSTISVNPTGTDLFFNIDTTSLTDTTNTTNISLPTVNANTSDAQVNGAVTIYDSLGNSHTLSIKYTHLDTNKWAWEASLPASEGSLNSGTKPSGTIEFDPNGEIKSITQDGKTINSDSYPTIEFTPSNGADVQDITLDLGSGTSGITQTSLNSQVAALSQNGSPSSSLTNINIDQYGNVVGVFSNGNSRTLAQLMVATFPNLNGLQDVGNNLYSVAANSGDPRIDAPGENSATTIQSGALEQSNVDLAKEFSKMIVSQRGFEANAKVVTTSDQILQDITNLVR